MFRFCGALKTFIDEIVLVPKIERFPALATDCKGLQL